MERDLDFCSEIGDLNKMQGLLLLYSDEYAKCELQKKLDMLRWATWHCDGLHACKKDNGKVIPYVGMHYVERYIDRYAGDILEEYERLGAKDVKVTYRLKCNHDIWFTVESESEYGKIHIGLIVNEDDAKKNLVRYVKLSAMQEVMGLTTEQVIEKYNGRFQGRENSRMDRWSEPDNVFVYHGFYFKLICDDRGGIVDLDWVNP